MSKSFLFLYNKSSKLNSDEDVVGLIPLSNLKTKTK